MQPKEGLATPAQTSGSSMLAKPAFPLPGEIHRIFPGGYKTNEDYVYVRGRGRGRYDWADLRSLLWTVSFASQSEALLAIEIISHRFSVEVIIFKDFQLSK